MEFIHYSFQKKGDYIFWFAKMFANCSFKFLVIIRAYSLLTRENMVCVSHPTYFAPKAHQVFTAITAFVIVY